jgi:DNA-binding HxlR family transcriptional regulator
MLDAFKLDIVRSIAKHDGEWYWYQLEHAIVALDPENLSGKLMGAIRELEAAGLLEISTNPTMGEIGRYWITEAGRQAISLQQQKR